MLKQTTASFFGFTLALLATACGPMHNLQSSPVPSELLEDPFYREQVDLFDQEPISNRKLSVLIDEGRVSKEPNNTDPVIFNVKRPDEPIEVIEEKFNADPDLYFEPSHDKIRVEEYFIDEDVILNNDISEETVITVETSSKEEKDETPSTENDEVLLENNTSEDKLKNSSDNDLDQSLELNEKEEDSSEEKTDEAVSATSDTEDNEDTDDNTDEETLSDVDIETSIIDTSEISASWNGRSYSSEYTSYLVEGIELYGKDLLDTTKDIDDAGFCPNYNNLNLSERMSFWVMFVSTVAKHESGFDTSVKYLEPTSGQYSRGLLQIGYNSSHLKPYSCGFESPYEMNSNPRKNLHCGVKILNHWISKDRTIRDYRPDRSKKWFGASRYWSVVRFEIWNQAKRKRLTEIKRNTQNLDFCSVDK